MQIHEIQMNFLNERSQTPRIAYCKSPFRGRQNCTDRWHICTQRCMEQLTQKDLYKGLLNTTLTKQWWIKMTKCQWHVFPITGLDLKEVHSLYFPKYTVPTKEKIFLCFKYTWDIKKLKHTLCHYKRKFNKCF